MINQTLSAHFPDGVQLNRHDNGKGQFTEALLASVYPPTAPNVRHLVNVAMTTWEFMGQECYPLHLQKRLREYDKIIVPTQWQKDDWEQWLDVPIAVVPYPITLNMSPKGPSFKELPTDKIKLLWVGGTDERHGFDLLYRFANMMSDDYHLVVKMTGGYKEMNLKPHPRITVIKRYVTDMSVLYRSVDLLLELKRAVGFSLPVLEALACDLPVVAVDLPPYHEFPRGITLAEGGYEYYSQHDLYRDTLLKMKEPDLESVWETVKNYLVMEKSYGLDKYKPENVVRSLLKHVGIN